MQKTCQRSHPRCERFDRDFAQVVAKCKQAHDPNGHDLAYCRSRQAAGAAQGFRPTTNMAMAHRCDIAVSLAPGLNGHKGYPLFLDDRRAPAFFEVRVSHRTNQAGGPGSGDARASADIGSFPSRRMDCPLSANPSRWARARPGAFMTLQEPRQSSSECAPFHNCLPRKL